MNLGPLFDDDETRDERRAPGPTRSTAEAMSLLRATRAERIEHARAWARVLIRRHGRTTSRAVRSEMQREGSLDPAESDYWLGAVFRTGEFAWTGEYESYGDAARNIHERTIKVWRLA